MSNRRESSATDGAGSKHGGGGRGGVGSASLPPVKLGDELPLQWRCVGDVNIEKRLHSSFEVTNTYYRIQLLSNKQNKNLRATNFEFQLLKHKSFFFLVQKKTVC